MTLWGFARSCGMSTQNYKTEKPGRCIAAAPRLCLLCFLDSLFLAVFDQHNDADDYTDHQNRSDECSSQRQKNEKQDAQ